MTTVDGLNGTIKAAIEELQAGLGGGSTGRATASGTDTYTATITGVTAYTLHDIYEIIFTNANTGSSTININSLGAKTLKKSVSSNLAASDIAAGQTFIIVYDGTNFQVIGLGGSGGSGTINSGAQYRLPYYSTNPTGTTLQAAAAITAAKVLISDANGIPIHSNHGVSGDVITFAAFSVTPSSAPTTDYQVANKKYVDDSAWLRASGGTLTGVNTITSNTANQLIFTGIWTATANNQYHSSFSGSLTARGTASDTLIGYSFLPTLIAGAATQTLVVLDINATFTPGAHAPTQYPLRIMNGSNILFTVSSSTRASFQIRGLTSGSAAVTTAYDSPDSNNAGYLQFGIDTSTSAFGIAGAVISTGKNGTGTWQPLTIGGYSGVSFSSFMTFHTNANVSIGSTTDNGFKLEVTGTLRATGVITTISTGYFINRANTTANHGYIAMAHDTTGTAWGQPSLAANVFTSGKNGSGTQLPILIGGFNGASWSTWMIMQTNGNIGVATTTDGGYKFDVNGTLRTQGDFTIADAKNIILLTTTGTKIGTATSQKLAFWNKTPIVQPTTGITGATLVSNGGTTITDTDTFGGYTLKQLAAVIINTGLAA